MPKAESLFWKNKLRAGFHSIGHCSRVESGITLGVPDVNLKIREGPEVWVELKVVREGKVHLRPAQYMWHRKRARAGGLSFFLTAWESKNLYFINDSPLREQQADVWLRSAIYTWVGSIDFQIFKEVIREKESRQAKTA